jgi:hypothetical protein
MEAFRDTFSQAYDTFYAWPWWKQWLAFESVFSTTTCVVDSLEQERTFKVMNHSAWPELECVVWNTDRFAGF